MHRTQKTLNNRDSENMNTYPLLLDSKKSWNTVKNRIKIMPMDRYTNHLLGPWNLVNKLLSLEIGYNITYQFNRIGI